MKSLLQISRLVPTAAMALAMLSPMSAFAVPALPGLHTYTQPDGTQIQLELRGDEYGHFYMTEDGYVVVRQDEAFYYALPGDATAAIKSSGIAVTSPSARPAEVSRMLEGIDTQQTLMNFSEQISNNRIAKAPQAKTRQIEDNLLSITGGTAMRTDEVIPTIGKVRIPAILVEYQDTKFSIANPKEYFTKFITAKDFTEDNATGSIYDYLSETSGGAFDPQFDVYGPVTLPNDAKYYGENNTMTQFDSRAHYMAIDACKILDSEVDFSVYDNDGDGQLDAVVVIYAGEGEATGGASWTVWPHTAFIIDGQTGIEAVVDGVKLNAYTCQNELYGGAPAGIGIFIHEFSHVLGLPDLYATNYQSAASVTPGAWTVMDSGCYNGGTHTPPRHSIFESYSLGWSQPEKLDQTGNHTLSSDVCKGLYVDCDRAAEFYLFEARSRNNNKWDATLPYDGMLVWHIDFSKTIWRRNTANNVSDHQRIDLVEADNRAGDNSRLNDSFPGRTGRYTSFSAETSPAFLAWSGYDPQVALSDIAYDSESGNVTFYATVAGSEGAINTVETDNDAPVEFFNLQGVRIAEPTTGVYIRRQGESVSKIVR